MLRSRLLTHLCKQLLLCLDELNESEERQDTARSEVSPRVLALEPDGLPELSFQVFTDFLPLFLVESQF